MMTNYGNAVQAGRGGAGMKVTITLTEDVMEFLRGIMDQSGDLAADGVEFEAEDYAGQVEALLEQMAEV